MTASGNQRATHGGNSFPRKRRIVDIRQPVAQFIINSLLQLAAFVVAIAFGIYAIKSVHVGGLANVFASQAVEQATTANQLAVLALCSSNTNGSQAPDFSAICLSVMKAAKSDVASAASALFANPSQATETSSSSSSTPPTTTSTSSGSCATQGLASCDNDCMPVGAVCCFDGNGDYCLAGQYCTATGCCPNGQTCTGVGGTSTISGGSPSSTSSGSSSSSGSPSESASPTPTGKPPPLSSSGLSRRSIAGIVSGAVILAIMIGVLSFMYKAQRRRASGLQMAPNTAMPQSSGTPQPYPSSQSYPPPDVEGTPGMASSPEMEESQPLLQQNGFGNWFRRTFMDTRVVTYE